MSVVSDKGIQRVIQESVAHIIASPVNDIYERLGIDEKGAIGILTLTPCETAIIAADIATKAADVEIGFLDRFTGSVLISGDVQSVETSLRQVIEKLSILLDFDTVGITKT